MLLSKATYSALRLYICVVSMCVPWESNPQRNALTTEPQEHIKFCISCKILLLIYCHAAIQPAL